MHRLASLPPGSRWFRFRTWCRWAWRYGQPIVILAYNERRRVIWEVKVPDCWIGVYFRSQWEQPGGRHERWAHVWVCLLPCLPLHIAWRRKR